MLRAFAAVLVLLYVVRKRLIIQLRSAMILERMAKQQRMKSGAAHVVTITKRVGEREYRTHLLRRSYREGDKVCNETLANLSHLGDEKVDVIRRALRGERLISFENDLEVTRSLPHGHVAAVLGMMRALDLERIIDRTPSRMRSLTVALICQRVLRAGSKAAYARMLDDTTLAEELGVIGADEDALYEALDYLDEQQDAIERRLAKRHLGDGTLLLYDVSSSYFEGKTCPLAVRGYSRDERRGNLQIIYGLLCNRAGVPIATEVFKGSTVDHQTVERQIAKVKDRFGLERVVLISDRGMVTKANLSALGEAGIDWITALKAPQVKALRDDGLLPLSLFDQRNLAEIEHPEVYPAERLIVCRNPLLAAERARKRESLLQATAQKLEPIRERVARGTLRGEAKIGMAVGKVYNHHKVGKHFEFDMRDDQFEFRRKEEQIAQEAALDGLYILRTSLPAEAMDAPGVVRSYKSLAKVERAFRTLKSLDLEIRPIHHRLEKRVRAHVFSCMLSYYLEYHLREAWKPLLFADEETPVAADPVAPATRSASALRKARTGRTETGETVHSYQTLFKHLETLTRMKMTVAGVEGAEKISRPTPLQARALELARGVPLA